MLTLAAKRDSHRSWLPHKTDRMSPATLPRDERDWLRLPMPHQAKDTRPSLNGRITSRLLTDSRATRLRRR